MSRSGIYDPVYGFIPDEDVPQEPMPQTNYDRLISKTPEELAIWIAENTGCDDWCIHSRNGECARKPEDYCCINMWLYWLKQEAGE